MEWNNGIGKHQFQIEKSIKTCGYSVILDVRKKRKKNQGVFKAKLFFCHCWTPKDVFGTPR